MIMCDELPRLRRPAYGTPATPEEIDRATEWVYDQFYARKHETLIDVCEAMPAVLTLKLMQKIAAKSDVPTTIESLLPEACREVVSNWSDETLWLWRTR